MKLEVGMYVRTKCGIAKITDIICGQDVKFDNDNIFENNDDKTHHMYDGISKNDYFFQHEIVGEPSFNITDLIEVGDVIIDKEGHKYPINYEFETDYNSEYKSYEITIDDHITLFLKDGLSIITKEQFEQMSYKVGEKDNNKRRNL